MKKFIPAASLLSLAVLAGCASVPTGPSVMVMPGEGRSFDQFRYDDSDCRNFASVQVGGSAEQAAADSVARSAVLGTVIGAAAGAAINGHHGAASGAGAGLLFGTIAGAGAAQGSAYDVQRRYDYAYQQCMYSKGNRIPGMRARAYAPPPQQAYGPPPQAYGPPPGGPPPGTSYVPPPGSAPPPPPAAPAAPPAPR